LFNERIEEITKLVGKEIKEMKENKERI